MLLTISSFSKDGNQYQGIQNSDEDIRHMIGHISREDCPVFHNHVIIVLRPLCSHFHSRWIPFWRAVRSGAKVFEIIRKLIRG